MPILDQSQTDYSVGLVNLNSTTQISQTFTTGASTENISVVKIWCAETGTPTGTLEAHIYDADGNDKPTGSSKGHASLAVGDIGAEGEYTLTFSTPVILSPNTKYCLVLKGVVDTGITIYSSSANPYANGKAGHSTDTGASWTTYDAYDIYFKTYYTPASAGHVKTMGAISGGL